MRKPKPRVRLQWLYLEVKEQSKNPMRWFMTTDSNHACGVTPKKGCKVIGPFAESTMNESDRMELLEAFNSGKLDNTEVDGFNLGETRIILSQLIP
jgi:hypothetical protein